MLHVCPLIHYNVVLYSLTRLHVESEYQSKYIEINLQFPEYAATYVRPRCPIVVMLYSKPKVFVLMSETLWFFLHDCFLDAVANLKPGIVIHICSKCFVCSNILNLKTNLQIGF